ncbi:MAG: GNAT family acetyltransferase [Verrucomicrobia bacterium]|nr:GNAT family acetyltransferase [Verrucomicrobiota bacterium]MBV9658188.1 GNAT family acetyltransferase [Verrucomicrobiota bacterium]
MTTNPSHAAAADAPIEAGGLRIRKYRPSDRAAVRWLCCQTGFLGQAIDPVFEDRELFADFLTNYYLDTEPESAFVVETIADGKVSGYLLGCRRPLRNQVHNFLQNGRLFLTLAWRYPRYSATSRRFIRWILWNGWREVPAAPRRTAHFHINLLPEARSVPGTRALIDAYLSYLRARGAKRVYGQMVSFANRRGEKMFQRYGFKLLNRAEITKYRRLHPEPVFLCTVVKDLEENERLYAVAE